MILNNDGNIWYLSFRSSFKSVDYILTIGAETTESKFNFFRKIFLFHKTLSNNIHHKLIR